MMTCAIRVLGLFLPIAIGGFFPSHIARTSGFRADFKAVSAYS